LNAKDYYLKKNGEIESLIKQVMADDRSEEDKQRIDEKIRQIRSEDPDSI